MRRHECFDAPILSGLFGLGGMLSVLFGPALVFVTGVAVPLGLLLPEDTMSYPKMMAFVQSGLGRAFVFAVISLFLWHAAYRFRRVLNAAGVGGDFWVKRFCYRIAGGGTIVCAMLLVNLSCA